MCCARPDFQCDSTTDGRPIKILSAVDEHARECLGGLVERSITAERLAAELERIVTLRGTAPPTTSTGHTRHWAIGPPRATRRPAPTEPGFHTTQTSSMGAGQWLKPFGRKPI